MKVYIVCWSDWEEHDIRGVYVNEQQAKARADELNSQLTALSTGGYEVEDYEVIDV